MPIVINEDIHVELLELLELYSELLLARFGLLDQKFVMPPPPNLGSFIPLSLAPGSRTQAFQKASVRKHLVNSSGALTI